MEHIFTNPGLQHVADRICYFLTRKSVQNLILTSKFMMSYSANDFQKWLSKCQKNKSLSDESLAKWKKFVNFVEEHEMSWSLGIMVKFLNSKRNSNSSNIYHDLKHDPFKIVSSLGNIKLIKLVLEKKILTPDCMNLIPVDLNSGEGKEYFTDCISRSISLQGNIPKTGTFKAFKCVLKLYLKSDIEIIEKLFQVAKKSRSAQILKILAVCLNQPNSLGHTPMHMLAYNGNNKGNIEVVKFAASICDDLNRKDLFGTTPMHTCIAVEHGYLEFVKALLPNWNNKFARSGNHEYKTAYRIAMEKGHQEIIKLMKSLWESKKDSTIDQLI